jgi:hypothetical protein
MKIPTEEQFKKYFDMLEEISIKLHICSRIIGSTNPEKQKAIKELQQLSDRLDELIKILKE